MKKKPRTSILLVSIIFAVGMAFMAIKRLVLYCIQEEKHHKQLVYDCCIAEGCSEAECNLLADLNRGHLMCPKGKISLNEH